VEEGTVREKEMEERKGKFAKEKKRSQKYEEDRICKDWNESLKIGKGMFDEKGRRWEEWDGVGDKRDSGKVEGGGK